MVDPGLPAASSLERQGRVQCHPVRGRGWEVFLSTPPSRVPGEGVGAGRRASPAMASHERKVVSSLGPSLVYYRIKSDFNSH